MKDDLLKSLALKAKNRLINKREKESLKEDFSIKIIKSEDEDFYYRVKSLLESEQDLINPIKMLMDEKRMADMSNAEKDKYLFQTIEKYTKFRNIIQCEKDLKLVY